MNTEINNNTENKELSPKARALLDQLITDFKKEIDLFEQLRSTAVREGMSDKTLRTFLVANTRESCSFIDAMLDGDYHRAMMIRVDRELSK